METDDSISSGFVTFTVDGTECPNTGGVGVDGVGGVFNCGLSGTIFKLQCTTQCADYLSIIELKLWKDTILTLDGSTYYMGDGVTL